MNPVRHHPIKYRNKSLVHRCNGAICWNGICWSTILARPMSTDHPNGGSFLALSAKSFDC